MHLLPETVHRKLLVKCEDDEDGEVHPRCPHGPSVLFYYEDNRHKGYYSCSAYRDKRCPFNVAVQDLTMKHLRRQFDVCTSIYRKRKFTDDSVQHQKHHYCLSCNEPLTESDLHSHLEHDVKQNLPLKFLKNPTLFLPPLDNDKVQAQYFFDDKSLQFFENSFRDLKISKVICMGAPRLHAHLLNQCSDSIKSFLLDFDYRFFYFYNDHQFAWYNMVNHHFFDEIQKQEFFSFLKCTNSNDRLLIFTDPPFACRTELIGNTLQKITRLYNKINQLPYQPLPIFWIFPYFSAHYVHEVSSSFEMSDYKINYTNHQSYTDMGSKARKLGSPVRLFTNVSLGLLKLPVQEQYKYCSKCEKYTALENRHCDKCKCCPSKNGSTYRHCDHCGLCVKPSYVHCHNCRRCSLAEGHNCLEYQMKQKCWICLEVGHTERRCEFWQKKAAMCHIFSSNEYFNGKHEVITCLLCSVKGHNELHCDKRSLYIKEITFMGETRLRENIKNSSQF